MISQTQRRGLKGQEKSPSAFTSNEELSFLLSWQYVRHLAYRSGLREGMRI